jgi:hypothetical protein
LPVPVETVPAGQFGVEHLAVSVRLRWVLEGAAEGLLEHLVGVVES